MRHGADTPCETGQKASELCRQTLNGGARPRALCWDKATMAQSTFLS